MNPILTEKFPKPIARVSCVTQRGSYSIRLLHELLDPFGVTSQSPGCAHTVSAPWDTIGLTNRTPTGFYRTCDLSCVSAATPLGLIFPS